MTEAEVRHQIREHISAVGRKFRAAIWSQIHASAVHDDSKFSDEEFPAYVESIPALAATTYGSDEYKAALERLGPALDHHYTHNPHHPEHHAEGIAGMTLMELIEMTCDWMAAVEKHDDGDIEESLRINQERFGIEPQLMAVIRNTVEALAAPTPSEGTES